MKARFADRVALITGGSSGIGLATVERLVDEGADVLIADLQEPIAAVPAGVDYVHLDVADADGWRTAVDDLVASKGRIDVLVQVAGTTTYPPIHEETLEGWQRVIATNQTGIFLGMKTVIPQMLQRGRGSIVNVSSHFALIAIPAMASYHASKGAVTSLSRNAAITYASAGIRVNCLHPGPTVTPLLMAGGDNVRDQVIAAVPMARVGEPSEQAAAIAFLASDDASFITGVSLAVDGGYTAA